MSCRLALNGSGEYEPGFSPEDLAGKDMAKEAALSKARKKWLFDKMESREDANKLIRDASFAFFIFAAFQGALSFVLGFSILIDASIYALGAFFLFKFQSRAAAIVLLILAFFATCVTVGNLLGGKLAGGNNVILALIMLAVAARAVEATIKLRGRFAGAKVNQPT